jgi:excisionase family DNA binding protein
MRPLLTFLEVADMLNCSKPTVERLVYDGALPSIKIRRATRFHVADVEAFIAE